MSIFLGAMPANAFWSYLYATCREMSTPADGLFSAHDPTAEFYGFADALRPRKGMSRTAPGTAAQGQSFLPTALFSSAIVTLRLSAGCWIGMIVLASIFRRYIFSTSF